MENNLALSEAYLPDPFEVLGALINILLYPLTLPFRAMSQLPVAPTMSKQMQIPQQSTPNNVKDSSPKTTYANNEEWVVRRNEEGRLESIEIHRKATRE